MRTVALEQRVEVETPEQVAFEYTIAGVGSRAAAAVIDYSICFVMLAALVLLAIFVFSSMTSALDIDLIAKWAIAVLLIVQFAITWLYYVLFEALMDGQTPGKKRMGLRVVRDGGYGITFASSAVRNIVRVIDLQPGFLYTVGMVSVIFSKSGKRLGDYVAGTLVVRERVIAAPRAVPAAVAAASASDSAEDAGEPAASLVSVLADDEYSLVERYLERRGDLDPARRTQLDVQLAARLGDRLPPHLRGPAAALRKLYEHERQLRSRGIASRSDTGAAREQHALVARGFPRWQEFAALLTEAQRTGLRKQPEDQVIDFAARYRELSADLARLRTATRGRDSTSLFYLSRLVASGHNLLYRRRHLNPALIGHYVAVTVPREIRRSWRYVAFAAVLLFAPAIAVHLGIERDPGLARELLGTGMIDRAETAREREAAGGGYLPGADEERGPSMAAAIMKNNVQVTFVAFAAGITAGLGTLVALIYNGILMGAVTGAFSVNGVLHLAISWIVPHGVLELLAICIAGGAGFLVGSAFLLPGALTRREALVVRGRRAINMVAGACLMLVVAGSIEGFVSPRNLPLAGAYAVGAFTGLLALAWLLLAPRESEATSGADGRAQWQR